MRLPSLNGPTRAASGCSYLNGLAENLKVVHGRFAGCIGQLSKAADLLIKSMSSRSGIDERDMIEASFSLLLAEDKLSFALKHLKNCEVIASTQRDIESIFTLVKSHRKNVDELRGSCAELSLEDFASTSSNILGEAQRIRITAARLAPHRDKVEEALRTKTPEHYPRESA